MYITLEYFNGFVERNKIPSTEWTLKVIENEPCFVLKNPVYCNVFWVDFWYHFMAPKYKAQGHITSIGLQDLTLRVSLTEKLKLLQIPTSLQNIEYYSTISSYSPYRISITLNVVLIIGLIIYTIIVFISITLQKHGRLYWV